MTAPIAMMVAAIHIAEWSPSTNELRAASTSSVPAGPRRSAAWTTKARDSPRVLGGVAWEVRSSRIDAVVIAAREHAAQHGDADRSADRQLGSPIQISIATGTYPFVVEAMFDQSSEWVGSYFVDIAAFDHYLPGQMDFRIYASGDDATIRDLAAAYPSTTPLDKAEFLDMVNGELDIVLGVVYALLALAVLIALLGIANTLALSIHERTRELGLLRAVGMTRRQLRAVVRGSRS